MHITIIRLTLQYLNVLDALSYATMCGNAVIHDDAGYEVMDG